MDLELKKQEDSIAISSKVVLPQDSNVAGNVHGGEIMKLMDSTAGIAATRYSHGNAVTARVDELKFKLPIHIGNYVKCIARVVYVGTSSMEIFVTVETENLTTGTNRIALTSFFTMVALDENGKPKKIPKIYKGDDAYSQRLYEAGKARYEKNKIR